MIQSATSTVNGVTGGVLCDTECNKYGEWSDVRVILYAQHFEERQHCDQTWRQRRYYPGLICWLVANQATAIKQAFFKLRAILSIFVSF